eukprot:76556-Chlamydomonas_euryale.AAC.2
MDGYNQTCKLRMGALTNVEALGGHNHKHRSTGCAHSQTTKHWLNTLTNIGALGGHTHKRRSTGYAHTQMPHCVSTLTNVGALGARIHKCLCTGWDSHKRRNTVPLHMHVGDAFLRACACSVSGPPPLPPLSSVIELARASACTMVKLSCIIQAFALFPPLFDSELTCARAL